MDTKWIGKSEGLSGNHPEYKVSCCDEGQATIHWRGSSPCGPEQDGWAILWRVEWQNVGACPFCGRRLTQYRRSGKQVALSRFGSLVEARRQWLNLTQEEMGRRIGVSRPTYAQMVRDNNIKLSTMKRIAGALGKELNIVLGDFQTSQT